MTPAAKNALATTIRALRERLLADLHAATESAYRLSIRVQDAGLSEAAQARRRRLEGWIAEQRRAQPNAEIARDDDDFRREAEKQAAYTLLNRLVMLRLLEAPGPAGSEHEKPLRAPAMLTGGWESQAYKDFRQLAPALARGDETEGYAFLLRLVFEDLATELPGLYGSAGVAELIPIPAATLRHLVEAFDRPELESCWRDDMTLGWVYQYWNDPEREALDAKLHGGAKLAPHEIASKTQMFTERYMVDWLLQNSLGVLWLTICRKHGWTPEAETDGTLERLEERRVEWRARRESGEVTLTELMPLQTDSERRWAYYVPQPIPEDAVEQAPASLRDLRLLDPAVGSGHFLVAALDLLFALYLEEARHRRLAEHPDWTDRAILEHILAHNLHGIDLDPRAVQIAAAALWLKARRLAPDVRPERLNLVASNLRLASLPDDDPALLELRLEVEREIGLPAALTDTLVHALRGADHLGSLLRIDRAVEEALERHDLELGRELPAQGDLFDGFSEPQRTPMGREEARATLLDRLERFLGRHTGGDDLGLRLRGEQLAAGVRFMRMLGAGRYDLVVANPPYQGTAKLADVRWVERHYPLGKADLYAAFLLRGLELVREGGVSAMLTMRNWMFIKQYAALRAHLLERFDLRALGDFDRGAFEDVPDEVVSVAVSVFRKSDPCGESVAICPTPRDDRSRDGERTQRKRVATVCQIGRCKFDPAVLKVVAEWPLVYWWDNSFIKHYDALPKFGDLYEIRQGLCTGDNARALRFCWEVKQYQVKVSANRNDLFGNSIWLPFMKGGEGRAWEEPLLLVVNWCFNGLEIKVGHEAGLLAARPQNEAFYLTRGVAVQTTGSDFSARLHRYNSVFGDKARSIFPENSYQVVALLNSAKARELVSALNPTIDFTVGDLKRLPFWPVPESRALVELIEHAFTEHEVHREPSVEFKHPGPSPWRHAQDWAQTAVDRPEGAPLPDYAPEYDLEPPTDHLSFALGVALGRFGGGPGLGGEGILDPQSADLTHALPDGLCFLDITLDAEDRRDSLGHPAAAPLHAAWDRYGPALDTRRKSLREWLALDCFKDVHRSMYENRPIHWSLSSANRTFVAWVNIHRFTERTLRLLLADHLQPALTRLDGTLADLRAARDGADPKAARAAERRLAVSLKARDELADFIAAVEQCADRGPPPTDPKCPARERDARYDPDLDDGVMINAAALWPLLDPQWKDPRKWWKELASSQGKKDYDWSHLAMRYWPERVDRKCQADPSLGVAHGCFWRYHPARAWAWELRLQDEIAPDFRIEEPPYRPGGDDIGDPGDDLHRDAFLRENPEKALEIVEKEAERRIGRGDQRNVVSELILLESGLWTARPGLIWAMELRLSGRQDAHFRLRAPDEPHARADFLRDCPQQALAAIEREAERRIRSRGRRRPVPELCILEAGLWSALPAKVWEIELRLAGRQLADFHFRAPDEREARAAFETENPGFVRDREAFIASLVVQQEIFDGTDDAGEEEPSDEGMAEEDEEEVE
ncbi:BREX-6 system adenine-specific DNA-methyltransferase PglX [Thiocystis violascens]|uniref:site-specific DNA-methyltransferase (adenine-specific) n=1 Tax=Thiocystis violascens (strain ATCC 17096 / DSM 198 / 6111) TaxID=765911 RepID=I3Y911_THIV6|nr:BREX-6 system adenine-specific DNA-methyltransferase PglX [Thiocystis violascens]AFL73479.1 Eco57I restriction endonuclease [Thiocystis violascens DSM 198]